MESTVAPQPQQVTPATPRRVRMWPALLTLLFLSPIVGEMISGSTPPLLFIQPFSLIFLPTLYGIWAILIREIIVRRQLGWGNVLLLGAAFGIFQEALVVQTWFNFVVPGTPAHSMGLYGVFWQTNWLWALNLTIYHAVASITAPLILIELFFPRRATLPWLRRRGMIALTLWMLVLCGLLAFYVGFKQFAAVGYSSPPPIPYFVATLLTDIALLLGYFVRFPTPKPTFTRTAPRLWTVRFASFGFMIFFIIFMGVILPATHLPAPITMVQGAAFLALSLWRIRSWAARPGWNVRHRLAVATGVIMYFAFLWGPLIEFGGHLPLRTGVTILDILVFIGLLVFDQRLKRCLAQHPSN